MRDKEFGVEKLLVQHGLWDKVEKHEDLFRCPLCEEKFEDGDLATVCMGKAIHKHCIDRLREKKE